MNALYTHVSKVTGAVHETLIRWTGNLLKDSGLESVDVWGRFPPEGTVRSHLVLFPYRVGPEPKMLENAPGTSLMRIDSTRRERTTFIPTPWLELGRLLTLASERFYPEAGMVDTPRRPMVSPYPKLEDLPGPLREWYRSRADSDKAWVVEDFGVAHCRPPAAFWKPGVTVMAHYLAVAGDPGRGVADRTSDAPPLSLSALSVLTVGIQVERQIAVELPPMPFDRDMDGYVNAVADALDELDESEEVEEGTEHPHQQAAQLRTLLTELTSPAEVNFSVIPVHDLSMQEFALLTQALQRPLQAVLNFRLTFELGARVEFTPSATVSMRQARNSGGRR